MPTFAILPVKRFEAAKSRLDPGLPAGPRRALAEAMYVDVLTALRRTRGVDRVLVLTADQGAQRVAEGYDAIPLEDPGESGQNKAVLRGIAHARELGATRVLCVAGDTPMIDPAELDALLGRPRTNDRYAIVVPDRHGRGTNALLLQPPDVMPPAYGIDSVHRHQAIAEDAGIPVEVVEIESIALDVDTPDDLTALRELIASRRGGAAHTRGMLNQLMRTNADR
ncbi:MAG TPA: 2-phospho-L-lactate guanylyltransferase [Conexibacter sp.]|jgi:2-phospho-L-lactate guanylyltransferase